MSENTEKLESSCDARRRILNIAVSTVLLESGFDSADKMALETLTEVIQCCISVQGIEQYAARPNRHVIQPPQQASVPRTPAMLSAGSKAKPAPHIPFHLPPLPDPHAYIRTPTHKQPVTEYEAIREKAASQKRDIERALTKFLAKTSETHNLFNTDDNQVYPLIACKPTFPPYLSCLLPTDQVFDFDELEYHFQVANRTEDLPADKKDQSDNEAENGGDNENSSQPENQDIPAVSSPERVKSGG
ncbi:transcription initiation factor TFIID subunit 8 isoform X2 [Maniola hyperantus]|uniref:transcription initiation factor TFIID subunit 8 isoform X2 n=1 Tax=Aphantopus hyperantus TaxID=2795564 RepID=UPI00214350F1